MNEHSVCSCSVLETTHTVELCVYSSSVVAPLALLQFGREKKTKGVEGVIEVANPNRMQRKAKKAADLNVDAKVELSRKEREEIERQRKEAQYRKLHEAGKTDEARRDLARLAIIRKEREEAARTRQLEEKQLQKKKEATSRS